MTQTATHKRTRFETQSNKSVGAKNTRLRGCANFLRLVAKLNREPTEELKNRLLTQAGRRCNESAAVRNSFKASYCLSPHTVACFNIALSSTRVVRRRYYGDIVMLFEVYKPESVNQVENCRNFLPPSPAVFRYHFVFLQLEGKCSDDTSSSGSYWEGISFGQSGINWRTFPLTSPASWQADETHDCRGFTLESWMDFGSKIGVVKVVCGAFGVTHNQ